MASFINATIDEHKFDALIKIMQDNAVHLKPVLAAVGVLPHLVKSPYKTRKNTRDLTNANSG